MDRTQAVAEKVDAIFAQDPRRRDALDDHRLQPARQRLQDQCRHILRDAQGFQGALRHDRSREGAERAGRADEFLSPGPGHRAGDRHPGRAAADSRHRHHRRLRVLDPGHRRRRSLRSSTRSRRTSCSKARDVARAHEPVVDVPRQHAAVARHRRPRQGDAAGRADRGRLQRDPGAVRLADREPVQPVQPRLVGDPAVRREVPADAGRPHAPLHALEGRQDGAAVGAGHHEMGRRPRPAAAFQRLSRGQDQRQPGAGIQLRRRDRRDGGDGEGGAAARVHVRVVGARVRGEEIRRHVDDRVRLRPHHRVPRARGAIRVVDAAGRRDVGGSVRHPGRARHQLAARPRQRRLLPDRPARADRARREERGAARVGCGRVPAAGQVDHGSDGARRRAAAAADHHDLARVRGRLPAARAGARRRRQRAPFDRHRHHRRDARRDHARDALRAAAVLPVRPARRAQREGGRRAAESGPPAPQPVPAGGAGGAPRTRRGRASRCARDAPAISQSALADAARRAVLARARRARGGARGRLRDRARLRAPEGRRAGRIPLRAREGRGNGEHRVVEAVRRPGARPADRHGARQQPQRQDRRRERRAGGGRDHADALAAVPADRLLRDRPARTRSRTRASSP